MTFCVVDIEMTEDREIIQFSAVKLDDKLNIVSSRSYYVKPKSELTNFVIELTGITPELLADKPSFSDVAEKIYNYIDGATLVCHGLKSDYSILYNHLKKANFYYSPSCRLDTVELARIFYPMEQSYRLSDLATSLNLYEGEKFHNAEVDALVTVNLLKNISEKIKILEKENYNKIKHILKKFNNDAYKFLISRREGSRRKNKNDNYLLYNDVKFKKIKQTKEQQIAKGNLLVSSIPAENYVEIYQLTNDYAVLKDRADYITLDVFSMFDKEVSETLAILKAKLYVWILETKTGDFSELNLLAMESFFIEKIKNKLRLSTKNYYYDTKRKLALSKEDIVINYDVLPTILTDDDFKNRKLIFEDSAVLGREVNILSIDVYYYRDVNQELNLAKKIYTNKNLLAIQENLESLIQFLHEMYISESLYLYNDSIQFIKQDINVILDDLKKIKIKLSTTINFVRNLEKSLSNLHNSYKFSNLELANSLYLKIIDDKNAKMLINKIYKREMVFVKDYFKFKGYKLEKLKIVQTNSKNEFLKNKSGRILIIFQTNKYRDLYFKDREKKSYIKNINFSSSSNFRDLYIDLSKNNKTTYFCYATKDILYYKQYLNKIFDEIIMINDLEK